MQDDDDLIYLTVKGRAIVEEARRVRGEAAALRARLQDSIARVREVRANLYRRPDTPQSGTVENAVDGGQDNRAAQVTVAEVSPVLAHPCAEQSAEHRKTEPRLPDFAIRF
jgi:hypothetical protein